MVLLVLNKFDDVILIVFVLLIIPVLLIYICPVLIFDEFNVVKILVPDTSKNPADIFVEIKLLLDKLFVVTFVVSKFDIVALDDLILLEVKLLVLIEVAITFEVVIFAFKILVIRKFDAVILLTNKFELVTLLRTVDVFTIKLFDVIDKTDTFVELIFTDAIEDDTMDGDVTDDKIFKFDKTAEEPVKFVKIKFEVVVFVDNIFGVTIKEDADILVVIKLFVFMLLLISVVVDIFEVNKFVLVTLDDIILFEVILFDIILFDVILVDTSFTVRILEQVMFVTVEFEKVAEPKLEDPLIVTFPTVISP
jgi:hypothetical protein